MKYVSKMTGGIHIKHSILTMIFVISLLSVAGCSNQKADSEKESNAISKGITESKSVETAGSVEKEGSGEDTTLPVTINMDDKAKEKDMNTESSEVIDLKELSEKYALQLIAGEFDLTYETLSLTVRQQMSKEDLKLGWDTTVASLGEFIQIYETDEITQDQNTIVKVILEYENSGLEISFTYNSSDKLDGLWLNYKSLKIELEINDKFEEAEILVGEGGYPVKGILTLPKGIENPPVVILVHGSGTHDVDETIELNKPFRDIAYGLAEQGIASIRYQEQLLQYPELVSDNLTINEDSLEDAAKAISYAVSCGQVDTDRIFIIGHSLGGMMAPKIASDHPEVAGIICLAGSPRKLEDIVVDQQNLMIGISEGLTEEQKSGYISDAETQATAIRELKEGDTQVLFGIAASYWYSLNQIDIYNIVKDLNIPMLIAQGSADWQVYADKDYVEWQELLGDRDNVTFHLYDNLNHLFMTNDDSVVLDQYTNKGTVDQQLIDDMAAWIKQQ